MGEPNQPQKFKGKIVLRVGPSLTNERRLRDTQNAQPFFGNLVDRVSKRGNVCRTQMAKVYDTFGRAFGGDDEF
jgi:hypothetical protein